MTDTGSLIASRSCGHFRFLDLIVEIRLLIYAELLVRPETIHFRYEYDKIPEKLLCARHNRLTKTMYPAILQVSKLVYDEAMPVLYRTNSFRYQAIYEEPRWIDDFFGRVGYRQARFVKHMVISMMCYPSDQENEIERATWRRRFDFEYIAKHTGLRQLDIEVDPFRHVDHIDWIYHIDYQLRNATTSKINVTVDLVRCPEDQYEVSDTLLSAFTTVGWNHRVVVYQRVGKWFCCRDAVTCLPTCDRDAARLTWDMFFGEGRRLRSGDKDDRRDGRRSPIWVGRTDWNNDDPMPEWPKFEDDEQDEEPATNTNDMTSA